MYFTILFAIGIVALLVIVGVIIVYLARKRKERIARDILRSMASGSLRWSQELRWSNDLTTVEPRAECILDPTSTIRRMRVEDVYERLIKELSTKITQRVREIVAEPESIEEAWQYLLECYKEISPAVYDLLTSPTYQGTPSQHVLSVVAEGVTFYYPVEYPSLETLHAQLAKINQPGK